MTIIKKDINYYVNRLRKGDYYSFPGFSDAEWFAMLKNRIGNHTAAGQYWTEEIGDQLIEAVQYVHPTYLPAVPEVMNTYHEIHKFNEIAGDRTFYERDMVTDDLSRDAGLYPFINQLQQMDVYIVSNFRLKSLHFLKYKKFFELDSDYNFHLKKGAIDGMVNKILDFGKPGVYLFACGMSDAVMIHKLHNKIKDAFLLDVGSSFDAFVGHGANRTWRQELYKDPNKLEEWKRKNLYGV